MFQTMPSMPVLAFVMPAVSGCIRRELPGWSIALVSLFRTHFVAARSDATSESHGPREPFNHERPGAETRRNRHQLAALFRPSGMRLARASTPGAFSRDGFRI